MAKLSTGELLGPFGVLLHNPAFGERWFALGNGLRSLPGMKPKWREIAILVVASRTKAAYEAYAHAILAEEAGVTKDQQSDIQNGQCPNSFADDEKIVWEVAMGLGKVGPLDQAIWEKGLKVIGKEGMMGVIFTVGYYHNVSTVLNGFDVKVADSA